MHANYKEDEGLSYIKYVQKQKLHRREKWIILSSFIDFVCLSIMAFKLPFYGILLCLLLLGSSYFTFQSDQSFFCVSHVFIFSPYIVNHLNSLDKGGF